MPRVSEEKRIEPEAFWRAALRGEVPRTAGKLLYRRGGGSEPMLKYMRSGVDSPYIPSGRPGDAGRRRNFGTADKRRIVEEAVQAEATVSGVAKKYGVGPRLLFQWKKDLMPDPQPAPVFAEVKLGDVGAPAKQAAELLPAAPPIAPPLVVDRSAPGIEVDL